MITDIFIIIRMIVHIVTYTLITQLEPPKGAKGEVTRPPAKSQGPGSLRLLVNE